MDNKEECVPMRAPQIGDVGYIKVKVIGHVIDKEDYLAFEILGKKEEEINSVILRHKSSFIFKDELQIHDKDVYLYDIRQYNNFLCGVMYYKTIDKCYVYWENGAINEWDASGLSKLKLIKRCSSLKQMLTELEGKE